MKIIKAVKLITFLAILIFSCSKGDEKNSNDQNNIQDIELVKTEYSGCFIDNPFDTNRIKLSDATDSLYYTIENDTLILHMILNYNCCGLLKDSLVVDGEDVFIYIRDTSVAQCYCLCDFRFGYSFTNFIGNSIHFQVYLKAFDNDEYLLWKDLFYNEESEKEENLLSHDEMMKKHKKIS